MENSSARLQLEVPSTVDPSRPSFWIAQNPLAKILDLAEDAIVSVDENERIVLFNQSAERIFGYSAQEITGRCLDMLLLQRPVETHRESLANFTESETARSLRERTEIRARRKDGSEFPAEAFISKVEAYGHTVFTVILRDVTDRVAAEELIKTSLREKELLLKEIHHRVKNNLQIISSLLGLQSRVISDEATRKIFQESQNRVHSMAMLHESLYQSNNLARIDFPEYIRQLAAHLFQSYGVRDDRIHLRTDLDRLYLHLDSAVPCGLIINELISNSLKYAFPGGRAGEIRIELHPHASRKARLVVADDGVGLHEDIDWDTARTLGLRLVRTLSEQLGAEIEIKHQPGVEVQLTFAAAV